MKRSVVRLSVRPIIRPPHAAAAGLLLLARRVIAKFHYTDPTRTRPDPHGPARTFLWRNSVGSVRVRSGPCSGI